MDKHQTIPDASTKEELPQARGRVPLSRILEKLDFYLNQNDYDAAQRHLCYWQNEATALNDLPGALTVCNELMGLYRKRGNEQAALESVQTGLSLMHRLHLEKEISGATTYLNAATVYKSFHIASKALPLYQHAKEIYEKNLPDRDPRLGGLYNNMALALVDLKQYQEAHALYQRALHVMQQAPNGTQEQAITYLNMADAAVAEMGNEAAEEIVNQYLTRAAQLLDDPTLPQDGYHAFICEKCAPGFGYYGWFYKEKELSERAKRIYERNAAGKTVL